MTSCLKSDSLLIYIMQIVIARQTRAMRDCMQNYKTVKLDIWDSINFAFRRVKDRETLTQHHAPFLRLQASPESILQVLTPIIAALRKRNTSVPSLCIINDNLYHTTESTYYIRSCKVYREDASYKSSSIAYTETVLTVWVFQRDVIW